MARRLLSTLFTHLDDDQLLGEMEGIIRSGRRVSCYYANFSQVLLQERDAQFRSDFQKAEIVVPDGFALHVAGRILGEDPVCLKTVNNTTDLFDRILQHAAKEGFSIYFLGGGVAASASLPGKLAQKIPSLKIAGCHHGYFGDRSKEIIEGINASRADIAMIGFGSPLQEAWLATHRAEIAVPFVMTVGAYISMLSEEFRRAPAIFRRLHLEWFYRLLCEPSRLWKRYVFGGGVFVFMIVRERARRILRQF